MIKEERKEDFNRISLKNHSLIISSIAVTALLFLAALFAAIELTKNDKIIGFVLVLLFILQLPRLIIVFMKSQKRELKSYSLKWIVINLLLTLFYTALYSVFIVFMADY